MALERKQAGFVSGTITNNPLAIGGTTLNSAELSSLPEVTGTDFMAIVLDPRGIAGAPEIVWVTAHTALATSATIVRGKEGTAARQHASGIAWVHGPTLFDYTGRYGGALASAATLTLPDSAADTFVLTGTTTINNISARPAGQRVYLIISTGPISFTYNNAGTNEILFPQPVLDAGVLSYTAYASEVVELISTGDTWYINSQHHLHPRLVGHYAAEVSTASTTPADLSSITGLSIPIDKSVIITGLARKTAGAAAAVAVGFKINGTEVITPNAAAADARNQLWKSSATNQAENGLFRVIIGSRRANYLRGYVGIVSSYELDEGSGVVNHAYAIVGADNFASSVITSITITGDSGSGSVTVAVRDIKVYIE